MLRVARRLRRPRKCQGRVSGCGTCVLPLVDWCFDFCNSLTKSNECLLYTDELITAPNPYQNARSTQARTTQPPPAALGPPPSGHCQCPGATEPRLLASQGVLVQLRPWLRALARIITAAPSPIVGWCRASMLRWIDCRRGFDRLVCCAWGGWWRSSSGRVPSLGCERTRAEESKRSCSPIITSIPR